MLQNVSEFGTKVLLISVVLSLLPVSPFTGFNYLVEQLPFLGVLNWLLPVNEILVIMETWLAVVVVYYGILYLINYVGLVKS